MVATAAGAKALADAGANAVKVGIGRSLFAQRRLSLVLVRADCNDYGLH